MQAGIPTFQVVDLPGIQTYPEEQEKATTELVSSYLKRPDTLVLCVLDATTTAFDSSVALKLIRESGKLDSTIVAMTKSDLLKDQEYQYVPKIFNRILGQSSYNQHLQGLAGCVAVANHQEFSNVSLAQANAAERLLFDSMMDDPAPAFADERIQTRQSSDLLCSLTCFTAILSSAGSLQPWRELQTCVMRPTATWICWVHL